MLVMRAEDLRFDELLSFRDGAIDFQGRRLILHSMDAFGQGDGHFLMEVTWHGSGEAEEHMSHLGKAEHPVCWMLSGYASGFMSYALGRNIYFVEQSCRAQGARVCTALGTEASAWGSDAS